jgi:hypothetical protein
MLGFLRGKGTMMRALLTATAMIALLVLTAGCGGSDDKPAARSESSKTADGWNRVVLGLVELEVPGDWEGSGHDGEDIQIWSRQRRGIGQFQALSRETTSEEMLADAKKNA